MTKVTKSFIIHCTAAATAFCMALTPIGAHARLNIVTSLPAIHSLVLQLTGKVDASASLLMEEGDSFHSFAVTGKKLRLLSEADLVVVIGLDEPDILDHEELEELRGKHAGIVNLSERLPKESLVFTEHCHDHGEHDDEHHGESSHDEHDEHGHAEHDDHREHDDEHHGESGHDEHDDHGHGEESLGELCIDSHLWLSVSNASLILELLASEFAALDPASKPTINENLRRAKERLERLDERIGRMLESPTVSNRVVWHDAYAYFAKRPGFPEYLDGGQSDIHYSSLSGVRLTEMREYLAREGTGCVIFGDPQVESAHAENFEDIPDTHTVAVVPFGAVATAGEDGFDELMLQTASAFSSCGK